MEILEYGNPKNDKIILIVFKVHINYGMITLITIKMTTV